MSARLAITTTPVSALPAAPLSPTASTAPILLRPPVHSAFPLFMSRCRVEHVSAHRGMHWIAATAANSALLSCRWHRASNVAAIKLALRALQATESTLARGSANPAARSSPTAQLV